MIEALLLDLDNTLIDRDAAVCAWLRTALPAVEQGTLQELLAHDGGGHCSRSAFFAMFASLAGCTATEAQRRFRQQLPGFVRVKPDAAALLRGFRGRTAIVTNGPSGFSRAKLAAAGLAERVDHVLVSGEYGVRKPATSIFHEALARLGCPAERALMVGDHPHNDVEAARAAGIAGVLVRTRWFEAPAGVRCVEQLTELLPC